MSSYEETPRITAKFKTMASDSEPALRLETVIAKDPLAILLANTAYAPAVPALAWFTITQSVEPIVEFVTVKVTSTAADNEALFIVI